MLVGAAVHHDQNRPQGGREKTKGVMGKPAPEHEKWTADMEKRVNMK